jgi:hypothetical protein
MYIEEVEDILDEFDFVKVQKVMEFLEWKWCQAEEGVPRLGELRKSARRLLNEVHYKASKGLPGDEVMLATGGFKAKATKYDSPNGALKVYMELTFEVTSWDKYD